MNQIKVGQEPDCLTDGRPTLAAPLCFVVTSSSLSVQ